MAKQRIELQALGSAVARVMEQYGPERGQAIDRARQSFLERPAGEPLRSAQWNRKWMLGIVPAVAVAAAILMVMWTRGVAPLTFRVDGKSGALEGWLAAPEQHSVFVDFSDGTGLRIERSSRARVVNVTPHGAKVSLESGSIHGEVIHTQQSAWSFIAGPINVRVTGTRFDLKWDPSLEQFSASVVDGSVEVSGSVAGAERPVRAGETLFISLRDRRLELANANTEPKHVAPAQDSQQAVQSPDESTGTAGSASPVLVEVAAPKKVSRWRELADRGQLREAFAAAESSGFADACQMANPAELLLLGDAARLAGRPDRASEALLALRTRYPNDGRRAAAAFVLGKVAFDQRRAYELAASWFSTCLQEQPAGGFAREASGRLIEAYHAAGNRNAAQTAARSYLARYPNGPHADLARSLLPSGP